MAELNLDWLDNYISVNLDTGEILEGPTRFTVQK